MIKKVILVLFLLLTQHSSAKMGFDFFNFNPFFEKKIFIIGASTVRYDYDDQRVGWGTALREYNMKKPQNGFNEARRGATAKSYKIMNETIRRTKGDAYWAKTKQIMEDEIDFRGGFLLIQFGGNDNIQRVPKDVFISELKVYIDEARDLGVTPILITPVNARLKIDGKIYDNRGEYPNYMKELAQQEDVIVLDLHQKSLEEFDKLTTEELAQEFGAIEYPNGRIDLTHFNLHGAKIVANWVQELACQESSLLCKQFK